MIARCSVHILPIQRPLIQSKLGRDRIKNMAVPIVAVVGVAFIPKDTGFFSAGFQWIPVGRIGLDWNDIRAEWML